MKEILELAGELANKMATISLHFEVGPDPKGERRLLEQWQEVHRQVAITHRELSKLVDLLEQSDAWTIGRIK